jgi:hypothetical protein
MKEVADGFQPQNTPKGHGRAAHPPVIGIRRRLRLVAGSTKAVTAAATSEPVRDRQFRDRFARAFG